MGKKGKKVAQKLREKGKRGGAFSKTLQKLGTKFRYEYCYIKGSDDY